MKVVNALVLLAVMLAPAEAQHLRLDLHGVSVTDRNSGVLREASPARGVGAGGSVALGLGKLTTEATGFFAGLSRSESAGSWDLLQLSLRVRFRVVGPVAVEGAISRRFLNPDSDGEEVGFAGAGLYTTFPVTGRTRIWSRVAYIPFARFSGTGGLGFAAEAQLGFELAIVGDRITVVGHYHFQRIDREILQPALGTTKTSRIELDVARVGVAFRILGGAAASPHDSER